MRTAKDDAERKTLSDIKNHGLHIVHVFGDEENPRFSYTVGLFENYLHPEIIILGLKRELAQVLLNNMAYDIKMERIIQSENFMKACLTIFSVISEKFRNQNIKKLSVGRFGFIKGKIFR